MNYSRYTKFLFWIMTSKICRCERIRFGRQSAQKFVSVVPQGRSYADLKSRHVHASLISSLEVYMNIGWFELGRWKIDRLLHFIIPTFWLFETFSIHSKETTSRSRKCLNYFRTEKFFFFLFVPLFSPFVILAPQTGGTNNLSPLSDIHHVLGHFPRECQCIERGHTPIGNLQLALIRMNYSWSLSSQEIATLYDWTLQIQAIMSKSYTALFSCLERALFL